MPRGRWLRTNCLSGRPRNSYAGCRLAAPEKPTPASKPVNADIQRLENDLKDKLGARVKIDHSGKGDGKLIIAYNTLDELDGILKHIR